MTMTGGCHCGAVRYEASGTPIRHGLCHCSDCRRHAGAPMVAWAIFPKDAVKVTRGTLKVYSRQSTAGAISARRAAPAFCIRTMSRCRD